MSRSRKPAYTHTPQSQNGPLVTCRLQATLLDSQGALIAALPVGEFTLVQHDLAIDVITRQPVMDLANVPVRTYLKAALRALYQEDRKP